MAGITSNHPKWNKQCVRIKRDGNRCRLASIRGGTVCHKHSGAVSATRRAAKERIQELKDAVYELLPEAIRVLEQLLQEGNPPTVRLRAAEAILDKTLPKQFEIEQAKDDEVDLDAEIAAALGEASGDDK